MVLRRSLRSRPLFAVRYCMTGPSGGAIEVPPDVSPLVHRIAGIVRSYDNFRAPMEERLAAAGVVAVNADVVEMVLKRCFKVGELAIRFFEWASRRPGFQHTTGTYNTMIYIASEGRDFDLVNSLLARMERDSISPDVKTWTMLISHYGRAGLIGEAVFAFEKMRDSGCIDPDEAAFASLIRVLCEGGKLELASEFYREMSSKGMRLDAYVYGMLMTGLSSNSARSIANDMVNISGMPESSANSCLLKSFCVSGRIDEAVELVQQIRIKNEEVDADHIRILVKGLCRAGRIEDAVKLVDEIGRENIDVYDLLVDGYLRAGKIAKAREILSNWKKLGFFPTVSLYTSVIQRLFDRKEYTEACNLYKEMEENGLEPDVVAETALVAGLVRNGCIRKAFEAFDGMKKKGLQPTRKAYTIFVKELCKASEIELTKKVLDEMQCSKFGVGSELLSLVMNSMEKRKLCKNPKEIKQKVCEFRERRLELRRADFRWNSDVGVVAVSKESSDMDSNDNKIAQKRDDTWFEETRNECFSECDLMEACKILSSSLRWSETEDALERRQIQFSPPLVAEILRNCQRHGSAVLKFFSWVARQPGYQHTTETFNMAIKISGSAKDFKCMRNLFAEMESMGCQATADTWTIMLTQYGRAGLTKMALEKFKEMKAAKCKPKGSTYKYLILFLCEGKGRNVDQAMTLFSEMVHAGFTPDKELAEAYLICLCEAGRSPEACKFVESVCRNCFPSQIAYSMLVKALCRSGRLEEAVALVDELEDLGCVVNEYIYGSLVHGLLRAGRTDDALVRVGKMREEGLMPTIHVYTSLIAHYFKVKQIEGVAKILREMRENGCEPSVITYCTLIRGYMNEGLVVDAWNIFRLMKLKGPFPDFKTYTLFIDCLCSVGRSEEGLQLVDEMIESGILPSTVNFRTVLHGFNREGKPDLARRVLQTKWALMRRRKYWN